MPATDDAVRLLSQLAELGMDVSRRLHQAAMAAEDAKDIIALSEAFCDAGRGMRQSIALWMRLESGSFAVQRAAPRGTERDPDAEPDERGDSVEREERPDWYERPDYETPLVLTGDEAADAAAIAAAVQTAVTRIRKTYARAEAVLAPKPEPRPRGRAALLSGTAVRRADSS